MKGCKMNKDLLGFINDLLNTPVFKAEICDWVNVGSNEYHG